VGIKRVVIIVLSIILLLIGSICFIITSYGKGNIVYRISNFNLYKNDFQTIADKMLTVNGLSNSSDGHTVWIDYEDNQVFCKLNGQKVEMTDKEKKAINNVKSAFDNDSTTLLDRIIIYKNRVTFCTEGNWYAVAYMIDDSKPQFMSAPKEPFNIKVKKIEKNWYHIFNN
jgi:hypothetical protein